MKEIPIEFIQMVNVDISKIEKLLEANIDYEEEKYKNLHIELDAKYQVCVKNWGLSCYGYNKDFGFNYEFLGTSSLKHNLLLMKGKLEAFKFQVNAVEGKIPPITINMTQNMSNQIDINISFDEVREKIESMDSLTSNDEKEILEKINEIERIVKSNEKKKVKWEKVKSFLIWLADKSVDVGIALLPLFLQINNS